jgi:hypothetical protein
LSNHRLAFSVSGVTVENGVPRSQEAKGVQCVY